MIRKAQPGDWEDILEIYANARSFMAKAGNPTQWGNSFPPQELIKEDIALGRNYVCLRNERIQGVFALISDDDPTYRVIDGKWLNDEPYCAVHRVASRGEEKGVASEILEWCFDQCNNIRIDTHRNNIPMQRVLEKNGYQLCGRIWVEDGSERMAYQKISSEG